MSCSNCAPAALAPSAACKGRGIQRGDAKRRVHRKGAGRRRRADRRGGRTGGAAAGGEQGGGQQMADGFRILNMPDSLLPQKIEPSMPAVSLRCYEENAPCLAGILRRMGQTSTEAALSCDRSIRRSSGGVPAGRPASAACTWLTMASAIASGVTAPMSMPTGPRNRVLERLGLDANLLRDPQAPCRRTEQAHVIRGRGRAKFPQIRDVRLEMMAHHDGCMASYGARPCRAARPHRPAAPRRRENAAHPHRPGGDRPPSHATPERAPRSPRALHPDPHRRSAGGGTGKIMHEGAQRFAVAAHLAR